MPAFLSGLPLHPLVVHAVVMLVPLAVLAGVTVAVWPAARRRFGWPAVAVAAAATASIPLATSTGEALRDRLAPDPLIATHAELGDQLLVMVAPMTVVLAGLVLFTPRTRRTESPGAMAVTTSKWVRPVTVVLAVAVVALAAASTVQVIRIGDSGARAVWHDTHYVTPAGRDDAPPLATTTPVSTPAVQPPPVSSKVCTVRDAGVAVGAAEGTAGTVHRALVFTNTGGWTCTIQGFPGVSFVAGADGHQVGEAAQRVGEKGPAVTLKPGGTATSPVGFVSIGVVDPETCEATPVHGLPVYPPQERKSEFVPYETTACAGELPVSQLTVRTVHEGSGLE